MQYKVTVTKFFGHLKTILIHKWWVFYYCCRLGIPWRGITHDLSKFSPVEFWEGVRFYTGTSSPINEAKKVLGYSKAWQHHKGRNTHHYEYWTDNYDNGTSYIEIKDNDFLELIADYLGAARAYMKKDFSYKAEKEWWDKKRKNCAMHINNKRKLSDIFKYLYLNESLGNLNNYSFWSIRTCVKS